MVSKKKNNNGISECWYNCFLFSVPWHNCFYIPVSRNVSLKQCHMANLAYTKKEKYSKGLVAKPSSSPWVLFVPATGLWGGEQTADAWPASAVRQHTPPGSHHHLKPPDCLMVCQGMKSATFRARGCHGAHCLFIIENMEQFIFPLYVTRFNWGEDDYPLLYSEIQIHGNSGACLRCLKWK